jgi:Asp-tRNA(Asn)/Glu-tRNA(Gln) amidotransferase A subunit family amidase
MSASSQRPAKPSIPADEDLAFAGVARLSELLRAGELTPRELVELYLARIERLDPQLNAFVSVDPRSLGLVRTLRAQADARAHLHAA